MADGELTVKTRDQWSNDYLRFVRMRNPNAKTGPDEYYSIQAQNFADLLLAMSSDARVIAGRISLQDRTGNQLDEVGRPVAEGGIGVPRPGAAGASGALVLSSTASGADIVNAATLKSPNGVSYHVVITPSPSHLVDGQNFAVVCDETGPQTNLVAGVKLTWDSPPAGCFATATVFAQTDGSGLSGGSDIMGDDDYRNLLADAIANPAASANDAELQRLIQDSAGHGVAVEKAFTYPALLGFGISGFTFTLRGSDDLDSRAPSSAQLNTVAAYVEANLPVTDGLVKLPITEDPMTVVLRIRWVENGWTNAVQWPPYMATASRYVVSAVTSESVFTVACADATYSGRAAPQVGQAIGLFDLSDGKFKRKTVLTVGGAGPWAITCDTTTTGASDIGYLPVVTQRVSPWSDSLADVATAVKNHINKMGPGECTVNLPEDGKRMARSPVSKPTQWPNEMDSKLLNAITDLANVQRATHEDSSDYITPTGSAALVYMASIGDIAAYPL